MGAEVRHKLISGISPSPNHSVGETTVFPEAFDQTLGLNLYSMGRCHYRKVRRIIMNRYAQTSEVPLFVFATIACVKIMDVT